MKASFDALMGARFLAALSVVLTHFGYLPWTTAVTFFFVMSGFILTSKYVDDEGLTTSLSRFWVARLSRIYPVYLLALVILVVHRLFNREEVLGQAGALFASVSLVQAWTPRLVSAWNWPGWTVSCEAFFYLLFPLLAMGVARTRSRPALLLAMFLAWGAGLLSWGLYERHRFGNELPFEMDPWVFFTLYAPIVRLPEFVVGMCLGRLFVLHPPRQRPEVGGPCALAALALTLWMTSTHDVVPFVLLNNGLLTPVYAVFIWATLMGGGVVGVLSRPLFVRLGQASYAFYILADPLQKTWDPRVSHSLANDIAYASLLTFIAVLVWERFEAPTMALLRRHLSSRDRARPRHVPAVTALALVVVAALTLISLRLPEDGAPSWIALDRSLRELRPTTVAVDVARVKPICQKSYAERLPDIRFITFDREDGLRPPSTYILTSKEWPQAEGLGMRRVAVENGEWCALWVDQDVAAENPTLTPPLGAIFGGTAVPTVTETGLGAPQPGGGRRIDEHARLVIPTPRPIPRRIVVHVRAERPTDVVVSVDDQVVWQARAKGDAWQVARLTAVRRTSMKIDIRVGSEAHVSLIGLQLLP